MAHVMSVHASLAGAGHMAHLPAGHCKCGPRLRRNVTQGLVSHGITSVTYCMENVVFYFAG